MKQLTCYACKEEKSIDEFYTSKVETSGHRRRCKDCDSAYSKKAGDRNVARKRKIVWDYLMVNPCIKCGEANPVVLEFDHRDPSKKIDHVTALVSQKRGSVAKLLEEIDKCDVLCANCHRVKTAEQFGYWKLNTID